MYRGGAVEIDGRGIVGEGGVTIGEVVNSETSSIGSLEFSVFFSDVFDESFEICSSSSSTSLSDDSVSAGEFALSRARVRPRLSVLSRVNARLRAFRTGATGVVIVSGLFILE